MACLKRRKTPLCMLWIEKWTTVYKVNESTSKWKNWTHFAFVTHHWGSSKVFIWLFLFLAFLIFLKNQIWQKGVLVARPCICAFLYISKNNFVRRAIMRYRFWKSLPEEGQNWNRLPSHMFNNVYKSNKNKNFGSTKWQKKK